MLFLTSNICIYICVCAYIYIYTIAKIAFHVVKALHCTQSNRRLLDLPGRMQVLRCALAYSPFSRTGPCIISKCGVVGAKEFVLRLLCLALGR